MIQKWIELGPIHPWLPAAMKLKLGMYGDKIVEVETEYGYLARDIEKNVVGQPYSAGQLRFSRIEPENALILDRIFSEAVEKATGSEVNSRVVWIREITTSLSEINGFLKYLAKMAMRMELRLLSHVILKHRESLLDLIELLTGSRYGYYYLIPGGARYDLTEGFQERLERWIKQFQADFSRIRELFVWTHSFQNRFRSLGRVIDNGNFGFVSEASVENTRYGLISHVESRLLYVLEQTEALTTEVQSLLSETHEGDSVFHPNPKTLHKSVEMDFETSRGLWRLNIELDSELKLKALKTVSPSDRISEAVKPALEEEYFEDIPVILESLGLSIPEIDR